MGKIVSSVRWCGQTLESLSKGFVVLILVAILLFMPFYSQLQDVKGRSFHGRSYECCATRREGQYDHGVRPKQAIANTTGREEQVPGLSALRMDVT